jgi:peroxiredoxin
MHPFRCVALFVFALQLVLAAGELSNRRAPGFSLPDTKLQQHDLYDYRGKPVLIEIMQTSCPSCRRLSVELERIKLKYPGALAVLAIVNPPDNMDTVNRYIAAHGITGPMLFDSGQVSASYLRVTPSNPRIHLPHLFLIDAAGIIRDDWDERAAVDAAKDGKVEAAIDSLVSKAPARKK